MFIFVVSRSDTSILVVEDANVPLQVIGCGFTPHLCHLRLMRFTDGRASDVTQLHRLSPRLLIDLHGLNFRGVSGSFWFLFTQLEDFSCFFLSCGSSRYGCLKNDQLCKCLDALCVYTVSSLFGVE